LTLTTWSPHIALDDNIRILLATDNHIGYNERDPIRGQDSINTFREILQLAVKHDVSPRHSFHPCSSVLPRLILYSLPETYSMKTNPQETACIAPLHYSVNIPWVTSQSRLNS